MSQRCGRAYVFIRWRIGGGAAGRFGEIGWAFENIDSEGRFYCFHCGALEASGANFSQDPRLRWTEKCFTLPDLIKAMSIHADGRPGFDEVKVFDVADANADYAVKEVQRILRMPSLATPLDETCQILAAYGIRGITSAKAFSVPFLWYNILPGRSVPVRRLALHLFESKSEPQASPGLSSYEIELQIRQIAQSVPNVLGVDECFITRMQSGLLVALNIVVDAAQSIAEGRAIADRAGEAIRAINPEIRHLFVVLQPNETS